LARSGGPRLQRSAGQDPGNTITFAVVDYFKRSERVPKLSRARSELSGTRTDLAENCNCQHAPGCKPFDHRSVKSWVSEQMAQEEIHRRTGRKSLVEIDDVESASVGQLVKRCQISGEIDTNR
jgi:hypothetical protein